MSDEPFVDFYEILQVSPNADSETIERVFRHLAKRYHPDNPGGGDPEKFDQLVKAHRALVDAEARAAYDVRHREGAALRWQLAEEAGDTDSFGYDRRLRARMLSLMYVQRRREQHKPGLGNLELSRVLGCPYEILDFHLWYLRNKGWIELTENGTMAITAGGVDRVEEDEVLVRRDRLLAEHGTATKQPEDVPPRQIESPRATRQHNS